MAVKIQKGDVVNIPEGAIVISRDEAMEMKWKELNNWKSTRDVFFLKYGPVLLSASSVISSAFILDHYRSKLKLLNIGRTIMFIPAVIFPALMIPPIYVKTVTQPLVLQDHCPVCIQMRGITVQSMISVSYPILVNTVGSFLFANTYGTYRIPEFSLFSINKISELFLFWKKISKRLFSSLPMHFCLQVVVAIFITEMAAKEVFKFEAELESKESFSS